MHKNHRNAEGSIVEGKKQGYVISPCLHNAIMDEYIRNVEACGDIKSVLGGVQMCLYFSM